MDTSGKVCKVIGFNGVENMRVYRDLDGKPYVAFGQYNRVYLRTIADDSANAAQFVVSEYGRLDY